MQAYRIGKFGLDSFAATTLDVPAVAPGMVLVRVRAVSLNFRDLMVVEGRYNPRMPLPRIPCSDAAGEIVALGEGVVGLAVGDRVCSLFMQGWLDGPMTAANSRAALGGDVDGVLAEYVALPHDGVIPFPAHLSYDEAATLPCAALTAWNALHHAGDPPSPARKGDTILIQGTGGVSLFALQFATLMGATVLGISSSDEKLARAAALGLVSGCNYRQTPDWARWVSGQTGSRGVDRVIEVGGAGTLAQALKATRVGGLIAQIGVLSGAAAGSDLSLGPILHKQLRVQGIYVGSRAMFAEMNAALAAAQLRPVIDRVFPFAEARQALEALQSAAHFGKIVIAGAE